MRLKQLGALLLASVMMVGTIGMMNQIQVQAETPLPPSNQYTLTVPAETILAYDGSAVELTNGLTVSDGDLEDGKRVTVTATSAGNWKLSAAGAETTIRYGLYASSGDTKTTTSWEFYKSEAANTGTTKNIYSKITTSDYENAEAGDYSDTITFTAKVVDATVIYNRTEGEGTLSSANLGTPVSWTYGGKTYDVYNAIIQSTSGSSWNDAMGFVDALNKANYDGHNDWALLSSKEMAEGWYKKFKSSLSRGEASFLWSSVEYGPDDAYGFLCDSGVWFWYDKSSAYSFYGFVILRGSSAE